MKAKVFVGILSARYNVIDPIAKLIDWAQEGDPDNVRVAVDATFGVDAGRSSLIDAAKSWGADIGVFFDSDVVPEISRKDLVSFCQQDFSRGYDMVVSPTLSISRQIMLFHPDNTPFKTPFHIPADETFPVGRCALGLFVITRKAMDSLKPLAEQLFINGPNKPLYCIYKHDLSEDFSLCDNVQNCGNKIACDPRLRVAHLKFHGIPSWRKESKDAFIREHGGSVAQ